MSLQDNWFIAWIKNGNSNKKKRASDREDGGGGNLFKEVNALREGSTQEDQDAIEKAKYHDGFTGQIAKHKMFEYTTLCMICFNAIAIGIDADYNATQEVVDNLYEGPVRFIITEWIFAIYFSGEVAIRFLAYKNKAMCVCDAWFVFDSALVSMMVAETWILPFASSGGGLSGLSILRLLRLLRITRISRIMRAVPEMMVIIKGMLASVRSVVCTGSLLLMVLYVWSILFTDAYHDTAEQYGPESEDPSWEEPESEAWFGTMGKSMFHLFIMGTVLDDVTACTTVIRDSENMWMLLAFILFILISSFMMLNMLIGVLVEVVAATADGEEKKAVEDHVREAIGSIFDSMDQDRDKKISRQEFLDMEKDKNVMDALADLDICHSNFQLYADLFFRPEDGDDGPPPSLSYDKLVGMIFRLRPGSFVSALDFASFGKTITAIHDRVKERVLRIEDTCRKLHEEACDEIVLVSPSRPDANSTLPPPSAQKPPGTPSDLVRAYESSPRSMPTSAAIRNALPDDDRERLERKTSAEIVEELQRRLGANNLDKMGMPYATMNEDLQNQVQDIPAQGAQAFAMLGVPQDDDDSGTVYV